MHPDFDFWQFFAGIGVFLWGMYQLELSLKNLAGKSFKNLLQKYTNKDWKGIAVGTIITAILQSSSLVSLMLLAFVGAKIIALRSAIGVILGANLGTTFTAWFVAIFGFKFSITDLALPFLGFGSFLFLFFKSRPILHNIGLFGVGFALLFIGLDFMKISIESIAQSIDLTTFKTYGLGIFLILGIIITALIQSSTATTVIVLSALSAKIINIHEATSVVIGANIGTSITILLGAIGDQADKKRLAVVNLFFKLSSGLLLFIFIHPIIFWFSKWFPSNNELIELVILNTGINLIGIMLFYPFLNPISNFISTKFNNSDNSSQALFIKKLTNEVPEVAVEALEKEIEHVFDKLQNFIISSIRLNKTDKNKHQVFWKKIIAEPTNRLKMYNDLKNLEEELTRFHIQVIQKKMSANDTKRITSLMLSLRTMIYSAKYIKDVLHNIEEIIDCDQELPKEILKQTQVLVAENLGRIHSYIINFESNPSNLAVPNWIEENNKKFKEIIAYFYEHLKTEVCDVNTANITAVVRHVTFSLNSVSNGVIHWKLQRDDVID
jgi:phosphate:Na+ symporter